MKKGKLNLDKKTVAKLSEENLENVQGGQAKSWIGCNCTDVKIEEPTQEDEAQEFAPSGTIVISCKK